MNENDIEFEIGQVDQVIMNRKARRAAQIQRGIKSSQTTVERVHKPKVRYNRKEKYKTSFFNHDMED